MAGQVWAISSLGGYFYSRQLSNVMRAAVQPLVKFRQFADVQSVVPGLTLQDAPSGYTQKTTMRGAE